MTEIKIYQADAFAEKIFKGNPAAVCPLHEELPEETMQNIAAENNLAETAFITKKNGQLNIRWFTPACEIDLCGHATLASAHVLFNHEGLTGGKVEFHSKSGPLRVEEKDGMLELDFPALAAEKCPADPQIEKAFGKKPLELYKNSDYMAVFESEKDIRDFAPDLAEIKKMDSRGIIVTAKGDSCDFVSRFFGPQVGIDEDPVTGSAHCLLTPYWHSVTGKKTMTAKQLSKRGGKLICTIDGDRVKIAGKAFTYMEGVIRI